MPFFAMITIEQLKAVQDRLTDLHRYLNIEDKKIQLEEEELRTQVPGFWDNQKEPEGGREADEGGQRYPLVDRCL